MTGVRDQITVLLVDDHQLIREGLRRAFDRAGDVEVVGEAATVAEAVDALGRLTPDVLVTDVKLPDGDGIALAEKARKSSPALGVVVLTMYAGDDKLFAALDAGASAFVGQGRARRGGGRRGPARCGQPAGLHRAGPGRRHAAADERPSRPQALTA